MPRKPKTTEQPAAEAELSLAQIWELLPDGERFSHGVYSIYKTAEGGMHISYRPDGTETDMHLPVPAMMMHMMLAASEGKGPMARFHKLAAAAARG